MLEIDYSEVKNVSPFNKTELSFILSDNSSAKKEINTNDVTTFSIEVPRGMTNISCASGIKNSVTGNGRILNKAGFQADSLFLFNKTVFVGKLRQREKIILSKQFSTIEIQIKNSEKEVPSEILLRSNSLGIENVGLTPINGICATKMEKVSNHIFRGRVLRQVDNRLSVIVRKGESENEYQLENLLDKCGMDWEKENLDDITVVIGSSDSDMKVRLTDWEENIINEII